MINLIRLLLLSTLVLSTWVMATPQTPTGLCINNCNGTNQAEYFPGTQLNFYPGYVINSNDDEDPNSIESRWQRLFGGHTQSGELRRDAYRPDGIYAGVTRRLDWFEFYKDQSLRPTDPTNQNDPQYDWRKLDAVFNINAVKNEGALVVIALGEVGYAHSPETPEWLNKSTDANRPDGIFISGNFGTEDKPRYRYTPAYHRPEIVDEAVIFYQAMYDHLVEEGYIDKVMWIQMSEFFIQNRNKNPDLPEDYNDEQFAHGVGKRMQEVAKIYAQSGISVQASSLTSTFGDILWQYMDDPSLSITYPDMKLGSTASDYVHRFENAQGEYQKDVRQLSQNTEGNGQRSHTNFASNIPNPWGHIGWVPQTASHILWAISGKPCDGSGDPEGIVPVHNIIIDFERSWQPHSPPVEEWHDAIERFGPPGTGAFPYLPQAYRDKWPNLKCN